MAFYLSFAQTWESKSAELSRLLAWKRTGARPEDLTSVYTSVQSAGGAAVSVSPPSNSKIASLLNTSETENKSSCLCSAELLQ